MARMARINRDIRFSKDKRPYKDHLDLWFWHGDKKSWDQPGFWFRITSDEILLGVGVHQFMADALEGFRQSVVHPRSGRALLAAVAAVQKKGAYEIGGKTRKRLPRGYEAEADRQDYLLYEGLYTSITLPVEAASKADFADVCAKHYASSWPIGKWLIDEVAS